MTDTPKAAIRPVETVLAVAAFILLVGNVAADWQSNDYNGGIVSVALIGFIATILGKNVGSIIGGGK